MANLTPEANRAARAILKWSVRDLAEAAGIAFSTVHRFETKGIATDSTKAKIVAAYAAHDVEITNGEGTGARLTMYYRITIDGRDDPNTKFNPLLEAKAHAMEYVDNYPAAEIAIVSYGVSGAATGASPAKKFYYDRGETAWVETSAP